MKEVDRFHRFVRWSDEDQVYIGYCPDLYFGGVCHGDSEEAVYAELCEIVRAEIGHRLQKGETLPEPFDGYLDRETSLGSREDFDRIMAKLPQASPAAGDELRADLR